MKDDANMCKIEDSITALASELDVNVAIIVQGLVGIAPDDVIEELLYTLEVSDSPAQARSLLTFMHNGWSYISPASDGSIDIEYKGQLAYIRTDGVFRHA